MTDKRIAQIQKRIEKIKTELTTIGPMRPGSLTRQYKGPNRSSGPYYQLSYTRKMKGRTEYVPNQSAGQVRRQIANYKRFKALTEEWIDLAIEHSQLTMNRTTSP